MMRSISVTGVSTSELEDILRMLPDAWKRFRPFLSLSLRPLISKIWLDLAITHAFAVYSWGNPTIVVIFEYNEIGKSVSSKFMTTG
jgi:hypothetical protein